MKSGVIHLVDGNQSLESFRKKVPLPEGHEFDNLLEAIDVRAGPEIEGNSGVQVGKIGAERVSEESERRITDDSISEYTVEGKNIRTTNFLYVPGRFITFSSSSGNFAIEVLREHTDLSVITSKFNIDSFLDAKQSADGEVDPWKVGFYENRGPADNGVVHGNSLFADEDVKDILAISKKNQIGLDYEYGSIPLRMFGAESGYVEVYQPSDFTTKQFTNYVLDEILPHLTPE